MDSCKLFGDRQPALFVYRGVVQLRGFSSTCSGTLIAQPQTNRKFTKSSRIIHEQFPPFS